MEEAKADRGL